MSFAHRFSGLILALALLSPSTEAALLDSVAVGETVSVPGFVYGPNKAFSEAQIVTRIDVYAPDARIFVIDGKGRREVPRSKLHFFVSDKSAAGARFFLAVSADGRRFEGAVIDPGGTFSIKGVVADDALHPSESVRVEDRAKAFVCGGSPTATSIGDGASDGLQQFLQTAPNVAPHSATVAVDTDNEFMLKKFTDNTANATNYLASLFAGMNIMYERDLNITLLQGTTFLRVSTTPDPYPSPEGGDAGTQLNEFGEYWRVNVNQTVVARAFAMQLSGKSAEAFSSEGVAWVLTSGNYCAATGVVQGNGSTFGHFSISRVFTFPGSNAADDLNLIGHELGHNFGAFHTHCTTNPNTGTFIDSCFRGEGGGCFNGNPSCPTDNSVAGRGSLMSYCNFTPPAGAGCGETLSEFHPAHEAILAARVTTNVGNGCFPPSGGGGVNIGPTVSAGSPASGSTTSVGGGSVGAQVSSNITFIVSGGSGTGTTALSCSVTSGTASIASGTPQTIAVGGLATAVVVRFTLTAAAQTANVSCTATPQGGSVANFSYTFNAPAGSAGGPVNNDFASASILSGSSATAAGSNVGANKESGEPDHAGNAGGASVWWQWTAPGSGSASVNTAGSSFDTLLAIYTGSSVNALALIGSNDDFGGITTSRVDFDAIAGTTYRIAVDGFNGETGTIALQLTGPSGGPDRVFCSGFEVLVCP